MFWEQLKIEAFTKKIDLAINRHRKGGGDIKNSAQVYLLSYNQIKVKKKYFNKDNDRGKEG